jgi:hypothetical protein
MPLFMINSGLILGYARKPIRKFADYRVYFRSKFIRSMPAYLGFSALIFFGKAACGQFMQLDNPVVSLSDYLLVLTRPHSSLCAYLWYIYVRFLFYAVAPLLTA